MCTGCSDNEMIAPEARTARTDTGAHHEESDMYDMLKAKTSGLKAGLVDFCGELIRHPSAITWK